MLLSREARVSNKINKEKNEEGKAPMDNRFIAWSFYAALCFINAAAAAAAASAIL